MRGGQHRRSEGDVPLSRRPRPRGAAARAARARRARLRREHRLAAGRRRRRARPAARGGAAGRSARTRRRCGPGCSPGWPARFATSRRSSRGRRSSREAVELARRTGDRDTLAYTLTAHFMASWGPETEELVAIADEVSRLAEETGVDRDGPRGSDAAGRRRVADARGRRDFAADDEYDALAVATKQPAGKWQGTMQYTIRALFQGDFAEAERLAEEALRHGEARSWDAECSYRLTLFMLRREQGRLAEIEDLMRDAADKFPGYRSFRCFVPLLELRARARGRSTPRARRAGAGRLRRAAARTASGCSASRFSPRSRRICATATGRPSCTGCWLRTRA